LRCQKAKVDLHPSSASKEHSITIYSASLESQTLLHLAELDCLTFTPRLHHHAAQRIRPRRPHLTIPSNEVNWDIKLASPAPTRSLPHQFIRNATLHNAALTQTVLYPPHSHNNHKHTHQQTHQQTHLHAHLLALHTHPTLPHTDASPLQLALPTVQLRLLAASE
jgi:hypothetical protein